MYFHKRRVIGEPITIKRTPIPVPESIRSRNPVKRRFPDERSNADAMARFGAGRTYNRVMPDPRRFAPPPAPVPFIGREAEFDRLEREISRFFMGPRVAPIEIVGDVGVGKSTLAAAVLDDLVFLSHTAPPVSDASELPRLEFLYWIDVTEWRAGLDFVSSELKRRTRSNKPSVIVLDGIDDPLSRLGNSVELFKPYLTGGQYQL
jgi:hypothetical protein